MANGIALGPPPLPPGSGGFIGHPFAYANAPIPRVPSSRSSSLRSAYGPGQGEGQGQGQPFPSARMSMMNVNNRHPPPSAPPPSTALPPIPSRSGQVAGPSRSHRRQTSIASSISSANSAASSRLRRISHRSESSNGHPPISPRTSSLLSPAQASSASMSGPSSVNGSPSQQSSASMSSAGHTPATRQRPNHEGDDTFTNRPSKPRTPSRRLLQNALDLAQKAVEMDRGNDVPGALEAYTQAVEMLQSVMERVGVEPPRAGKRKDAAKAEEEGRTLRGIVSGRDTKVRHRADFTA